MISIECKLKGQKTEVHEQRNQLEAIRALFTREMAVHREEPVLELEALDIE
jgi:hypothetical protein